MFVEFVALLTTRLCVEPFVHVHSDTQNLVMRGRIWDTNVCSVFC
jgi:hypothetical protein